MAQRGNSLLQHMHDKAEQFGMLFLGKSFEHPDNGVRVLIRVEPAFKAFFFKVLFFKVFDLGRHILENLFYIRTQNPMEQRQAIVVYHWITTQKSLQIDPAFPGNKAFILVLITGDRRSCL